MDLLEIMAGATSEDEPPVMFARDKRTIWTYVQDDVPPIPGVYDFAFNNALDDWTLVNTSNGSVSASGGVMTITTNANLSQFNYSGPGAELLSPVDGDFSTEFILDKSDTPAVANTGIAAYFDGGSGNRMELWFYNTTNAIQAAKRIGGSIQWSSSTTVATERIFVKITNISNTWSFYYKVNAIDNWITIGSQFSNIFTSTPNIRFAAANSGNTTTPFDTYVEDVRITDGFNRQAVSYAKLGDTWYSEATHRGYYVSPNNSWDIIS